MQNQQATKSMLKHKKRGLFERQSWTGRLQKEELHQHVNLNCNQPVPDITKSNKQIN